MDLKLEPRDSYRDARVMCECYPEATGEEILKLVAHDKKCHELYIQKGQEKVRAFADKINKAPQYYKGRFGLDQRYFYKVSNAKVYADGTLVATVEKIVVFIGGEHGVIKEGCFSFEKKISELADVDKYGLGMCMEINQKEWDKLNEYCIGVTKFWDDFKWE